MLVAERRARIAQLIEQQGSVRVAELSDHFGVTEETIRRDLEGLERQGVLKRGYGGAVKIGGLRAELPIVRRIGQRQAEKRAIAKAALSLIGEGETIGLDASTSALRLAQELGRFSHLTVFTNAVQVVSELAQHPDIITLSTGGTLRHTSLSFVGPLAARAVRDYHLDKIFLSGKGLVADKGLTDSDELEVELKKQMIASSREVIALVDSSKFGYVGFASICGIRAVDTVITDQGISAEGRAALEERGVEVIVAG